MSRKRLATIATITFVLAGSAHAGALEARTAESNDAERGRMLNLVREDLMEDSRQSTVAIKPTTSGASAALAQTMPGVAMRSLTGLRRSD